MHKKLGFSKQILIILISLGIICTCLMGFVGYSTTQKLNNDLVLKNLQNLTDSTYNLIDSSVNASVKNYLRAVAEKNRDIVQLYYDKYKKGEISESEAKEEAEKIISSQTIGDSGYVYVLNSEGVLKVHPFLKNLNISNYDFIKEQISKKQGYIEYNWKNPGEEEPREKVLYMVYFKEWDYIISASSYKSEFFDLVSVSDFKDNILSIVTGRTGYMSVINSKGDLIIHPKLEGTNIYNSMDNHGRYFVQEIIKNKNGIIVFPWMNPGESAAREKIVIYKYYEPMDWYLCCGVYTDELTEPIVNMRNVLIMISIAILLLAIILAAISSRIILKPIKVLTDAAQNVTEGNFKISIENSREDEIGILADVFNKMIKKINNSIEELRLSNNKLEETNVNLEVKVEDRTAQLTENNKKLEIEIIERKNVEKLLEIRYTELREIKKNLEEVNEKLEKLSNLDGLTGIANRRKMDEYLMHEWKVALREKKQLSLIMLDIDFFKKYNDVYGHPAGDECLIKVANGISIALRRPIDFLARYGGEEFMVVLIDVNQSGAKVVAEGIKRQMDSLEIPHSDSEISEHVTLSMGITTLLNYNNDSLIDFIESADQALYKAKKTGRNRFVCVEY